MSKKFGVLKTPEKTNFLQKFLCVNNVAYIVVIIGVIFIVVCGIYLFKRIGKVKEQLESCRSSMRDN